jgi:cyclophilin family peptidyl-prolyl cis-trans isomerase
MAAMTVEQAGAQGASPEGKEIVVIETSLGTFEAEMYRADAPKTVENFVRLAEKKYFNGIIFHRVSKGFVIQG